MPTRQHSAVMQSGTDDCEIVLRREKALGVKPSEVQLSCGNFQMHWASNMFRGADMIGHTTNDG